MQLRKSLLVAAVGALTIAGTACDTPTETSLLPALEPDTGNLGLLPVNGFQVFTLVDDSVVKDSALKAMLARRRAEPTVASARVIRLAEGIDSMIAVGRTLAFDVSPTRRLVFLLTDVTRTTFYTAWRGTLQGGLYGDISIVSTSGTGIGRANITVSAPRYFMHSIEQLGGGLYVVVYVDYRKFPPD